MHNLLTIGTITFLFLNNKRRGARFIIRQSVIHKDVPREIYFYYSQFEKLPLATDEYLLCCAFSVVSSPQATQTLREP